MRQLNKLLLILFIILFAISKDAIATHIGGGTLEYIRLGPGSFPNSSRYKIKLKVYRNDTIGAIQLPDKAIIYVRGDWRQPFDPALKAAGNSVLDSRYSDDNIFSRDFTISSSAGSALDTLTVRSEAVTSLNYSSTATQDSDFFFYDGSLGFSYSINRQPNTSIPAYSLSNPISTIPGYEYSEWDKVYPSAHFMADRHLSSIPGMSIDAFGFFRKYKVIDNSRLNDTCINVTGTPIEVQEFIRVIDLPNIPGGYHVYYEIYARSALIKNIKNPATTGITLYTRIPDLAVLDPDADSYTKLYKSYAANGLATTLGVGSVFSFAGLNAGVGINGGYLNDAIRTGSITGIIKQCRLRAQGLISFRQLLFVPYPELYIITENIKINLVFIFLHQTMMAMNFYTKS